MKEYGEIDCLGTAAPNGSAWSQITPGPDDYSFRTTFRLALGSTQPATLWVPGAFSLGLKRTSMKLTTHLHLAQRLRMCEAIPPLPQYSFMAWCLVKQRDNFTFTLPDEYGAVVGLWLAAKIDILWEIPAPVLQRPQKVPHGMPWKWNRASEVEV
jgi:hypothetical protein